MTSKGPLAEARLWKDLSIAENHKMEREKKRGWKSSRGEKVLMLGRISGAGAPSRLTVTVTGVQPGRVASRYCKLLGVRAMPSAVGTRRRASSYINSLD